MASIPQLVNAITFGAGYNTLVLLIQVELPCLWSFVAPLALVRSLARASKTNRVAVSTSVVRFVIVGAKAAPVHAGFVELIDRIARLELVLPVPALGAPDWVILTSLTELAANLAFERSILNVEPINLHVGKALSALPLIVGDASASTCI
jgi:hypothetical protein